MSRSQTHQIHLVRHAEAIHNATGDKTIIDPPLTAYGQSKASNISSTFPRLDKVALILTSPLRRALQTALAGFSPILSTTSPRPSNVAGIENGAQLLVYPEIQPRTDKPSDVGTEPSILETEFPGLDFSTLNECWPRREGAYADTDAAISARGQRVRDFLAEALEGLEGKERTDIVLVTHGVVRGFVGGDAEDGPWDWAGCVSYVVVKDQYGVWKLIATRERLSQKNDVGPQPRKQLTTKGES